jgi:hypothetical protein
VTTRMLQAPAVPQAPAGPAPRKAPGPCRSRLLRCPLLHREKRPATRNKNGRGPRPPRSGHNLKQGFGPARVMCTAIMLLTGSLLSALFLPLLVSLGVCCPPPAFGGGYSPLHSTMPQLHGSPYLFDCVVTMQRTDKERPSCSPLSGQSAKNPSHTPCGFGVGHLVQGTMQLDSSLPFAPHAE